MFAGETLKIYSLLEEAGLSKWPWTQLTGRVQGHLCPLFDAGFEFMPCCWLISDFRYQGVKQFIQLLSSDFTCNNVHIHTGWLCCNTNILLQVFLLQILNATQRDIMQSTTTERRFWSHPFHSPTSVCSWSSPRTPLNSSTLIFLSISGWRILADMESACSEPPSWYQPLKIRHSSTWSDDLIRRGNCSRTSGDSRMCHMVNAMERFLFGTQHTKYPVLISCLGWVNVWAMLNVFPNGKAACRHFTANKSSDSHITQPVSKTTLFSSHLGCPTSDIYKISGSLDRGKGGMKGTRREP